MDVTTITRNLRTYVAPVAYMTIAFVAVLAYGPDAWTWLTDVATGLSHAVAQMFGIGQHARPASGLACWNEIKASLPTEHLCGDVAHAPASAVDFTSYPTN